jgi:transposase InsO family protein
VTNDEEAKRTEEVALFRYGLIADLVHLPPGDKGLYRRLLKKAEGDYRIPGTARSRVAAETLRDWLKAYRKAGFEGLRPRPRKDVGQSRALPQEVVDQLMAIKDDNREYSVQLVIKEALASGKVPAELPLAPTTVHRLLARAGLMRREDSGAEGDRRRFAFQKAGELWMSDVMHGPSVLVGGKVRRKTYLIGFLDDATRVVPYAAFALSENTTAFIPIFKQAVLRRGISKRLFVDNGAAYRSHHLSLVCAKLGVTLIHARAYQPESKGKIERWHRTVRMQLLPTLTEADTSSLEKLNRRLWAYVEGEYHQTPHRGLDRETPLDRWAKCADEVRYLPPQEDLDALFLSEAKRKVQKDRTVSLNGLVYEVDASLVGTTVTLRFDPSQPGRAIQVWAAGEKSHTTAKVVDVYANCFVKRDRPSRTLTPSSAAPPPPAGLRLADLGSTSSDEECR